MLGASNNRLLASPEDRLAWFDAPHAFQITVPVLSIVPTTHSNDRSYAS